MKVLSDFFFFFFFFFFWGGGGARKNRLREAVLTGTRNLCFGVKIRKIGILLLTPVVLYKGKVFGGTLYAPITLRNRTSNLLYVKNHLLNNILIIWPLWEYKSLI